MKNPIQEKIQRSFKQDLSMLLNDLWTIVIQKPSKTSTLRKAVTVVKRWNEKELYQAAKNRVQAAFNTEKRRVKITRVIAYKHIII